jgi:hypothetical protein
MSETLKNVAAFGSEASACGTADPAPSSACGAADPAPSSACGAADPDKK